MVVKGVVAATPVETYTPAAKFKIRLYIAGQSARTVENIRNLRNFLDKEFNVQYEYEVVNLLEDPLAAATDNIFATPTIVKALPLPSKKVIGDISNPQQVAVALGLTF